MDEFVVDLLKALSIQGTLGFLDALGGGLFALELRDVLLKLSEDGWEIKRNDSRSLIPDPHRSRT